MSEVKKPIWLAKVKTESGDESVHGYWTVEPTEQQVAFKVLNDIPHEISYWVEQEGHDLEWARINPLEALEMAMIDPSIVSLGMELLD